MGGRSSGSQSQSSQGWGLDQAVGADMSNSMSQSGSYGTNMGESFGQSGSQSTGNSFGQSGSASTGTSGSQSSSLTGQNVWNPQGDALQSLYGQAGAAAGQNWNPYINQYANATSGLMGQGQQAISSLQGYDPQAQIAAQETSLRSGLDNMVAGQLNNLKGQAAMSGAFGGARHGLTEGAAIGEAARAYTEGMGDIVANANQQGIAANSAIGAMLPSLQGMQGNVGSYAQSMTMNPLQSLAGIYGQGPTTLNFGQSGSTSFGNQSSSSFGNQGSTNQSTSFGNQGSYNFGQNSSFANSLSQALGFDIEQALRQQSSQGQQKQSSWDVDNFFGSIF